MPTVSVRGTDFAMTIDEIGSSTIILLPSCDVKRNCFVGEIAVESDAGMVIMNQAFQPTQVDTPESNPLKPIILDLNESLINNLLIVQKPQELEDAIEQEAKLRIVANALDIDFLKFDDLEVDLLETKKMNMYVTFRNRFFRPKLFTRYFRTIKSTTCLTNEKRV